jgi:hypothetical protein
MYLVLSEFTSRPAALVGTTGASVSAFGACLLLLNKLIDEYTEQTSDLLHFHLPSLSYLLKHPNDELTD